MEWNLNAPSEWDWEIEMPKNLPFCSHENGDCSFPGFGDSMGKDRVEAIKGGFSDTVEEASVLSGEAMIGLKLGRLTYCQDKAGASYPLVPASTCSPIMKRSRASYQSSQSPRCQVEGCHLDLTSAKDYHRRHRICADHSKSPKVIVAGMERRFCQQCSRFHDLSEFDDRKRSCRRRLFAHNARRRRPQSEDVQFSSTHRRPYMSFHVNQVSIASPNSTIMRSSSNFKGGDFDVMPNNDLSDNSLSFQGVTPGIDNHNSLEAGSNPILVTEVRHAFSLQTTSSWGFSGPKEPLSFDQFLHGHNIALTQPGMPVELQNTGGTQQPPHDFECFYSY